MFTAMLWKEYRDGRTVWTALALLGVSTLVIVPVVAQLFDLPHDQDQSRVLFLLEVWLIVYGMVGGSLFLAGERESSTLPFLDLLQPRRGLIWLYKVLAGGIFILLMGGLFAVLYGITHAQHGGWRVLLEWDSETNSKVPLFVLLLVGFDVLPWGLAASSVSRSVMVAVALGTAAFLLSWIVSGVFGQAIAAVLISRLVFNLMALGFSAVMFAQAEPNGPPQGSGSTLVRELLLPRITAQGGFLRVQFWLCRQQGATLIKWMLGGAMVAGFVLSPLAVQMWPLATLLVGVLCGLTVWSDEQAGGHAKFLGDRRFPLFRIWLFKSAFWLGVGVLVLFVAGFCGMLGTGVARWHAGGRIRDDGFVVLRYMFETYNPFLAMTMWMLYGFSLAQLTVMVWRKPVVTFVLTFMGSLAVAGLWLPSLMLGGLPFWQVLVPPLFWLATAALLLWSWSSVGLGGRRQVALLLMCSAATGLWLTACLTWRTVEVPEVAAPFDVAAFQQSLPNPEQNEAPRQIQQALGLNPGGGTSSEDVGQVSTLPAGPRTARAGEPPIEELLVVVIEQGWQNATPELIAFLDARFRVPAIESYTIDFGVGAVVVEKTNYRWLAATEVDFGVGELQLGRCMYRSVALEQLDVGVGEVGGDTSSYPVPWIELLDIAVHRPLGVLDDPTVSRTMMGSLLQRLRVTALQIAGRAAQLHAMGHSEEAVRYIDILLTLSRQIRNKAPLTTLQQGIIIERMGLEVSERIFPALVRHEPDLAARLLQLLRDHDPQVPPITDNLNAEYLLLLPRLNGQASPLSNDPGADQRGDWHWYSQLLTTSLQTPWERARTDRLYQLAYAQSRQDLTGEVAPEGGNRWVRQSWLRLVGPRDFSAFRIMNEATMCRVRGLQLALALALYERQHGQPAPTLATLCPTYLERLPVDPFSGKDFKYRIAQADERLHEAAPDYPVGRRLRLEEGQGIVWSTGPDRRDDEGKMNTRVRNFGRRETPAGDWLFIVPPK